MRRRTFLRTGALASVVASTAVAGCQSGSGQDPNAVYVPREPNYQGWFTGVSNYAGTVDERGAGEVTVEVGVRGSNGYYYFGPAAVAVSPGTTVTWEWTGKGGTHNVVSTSGAFTSGALVDEDGYTYANGFERPGVFRYYCSPHQSLGMKGAVFVALGRRGDEA